MVCGVAAAGAHPRLPCDRTVRRQQRRWLPPLCCLHAQGWSGTPTLLLVDLLPAACRVWDNDGEFLLIEAAYGLPRWLKPETAQNRLWLHGGAVHLVPLPRHAGESSACWLGQS